MKLWFYFGKITLSEIQNTELKSADSKLMYKLTNEI